MNNFYIYKVIHNNEVIYCGKGCGARVSHVNGKSSNSSLNEHYFHCKFNNLPLPSVEIVDNLSEAEALRLEHHIIYTHKPKYNTQLKYTPPQDYVFEEEYIVEDMWSFD